jgi:hypothetical protein
MYAPGAKAPYARTTSVQAPIQSQRCLGEGGLGRDQQGVQIECDVDSVFPRKSKGQRKTYAIRAFLRLSPVQAIMR